MGRGNIQVIDNGGGGSIWDGRLGGWKGKGVKEGGVQFVLDLKEKAMVVEEDTEGKDEWALMISLQPSVCVVGECGGCHGNNCSSFERVHQEVSSRCPSVATLHTTTPPVLARLRVRNQWRQHQANSCLASMFVGKLTRYTVFVSYSTTLRPVGLQFAPTSHSESNATG